MITAQQVRDEAAKIAGRLAASASAGEHCATVSEVLFLGEFDRLVARLSGVSDRISEKPAAADPNADAEALADEIVASAATASGETGGAPSEAEALAREINAQATAR